MKVLFVTGAGTDIGKTYVTALYVRKILAAGRKVLALKPVASGVPPIQADGFAQTDTAVLLAAQGVEPTAAAIDACSPWRFTAALSPDMAAAAEGRSITLEDLLVWLRTRIAAADQDALVLIEGVGGVMSPMTSDALNLDVIKALACPVIVVAGSYLGAVNHALTALETLKAHGAHVEALVVNESAGSTVDFEATLDTLARFAPGYAITPVRRGDLTMDLDLI